MLCLCIPPILYFASLFKPSFPNYSLKGTHLYSLISHFNRNFLDEPHENSNFLQILQRVGSLSNALSVCHPAQTGNPITYKGIRKVLPAESIYPIPIVVWKSKILRVVLFQELLFKTMQCLFRVENQNLKISVGFKNNNCASKKKEFLKKRLYAKHMFLILITLVWLNKYVDLIIILYVLIFLCIILFQ